MPTGEHESPAHEDGAPSLDPPREPSPRLLTVEIDGLVEAALSEREPVGPPMPDPYLGLEIDRRYFIESLIAAGGMGLVYRCRHTVLGKKLAIKIIRGDVAQMPDGTDRFLIEAKAASAIGHEHIVDIADYGSLPDGSPYLVMEYLEGVSLSTLLREEPGLGVSRIAHIAIQIAEGLGAAHAAGIVHRDLKPDNVFVLERKGEDFIKILDFGVARMAQNAKKLTQAGTIVGTPHYMSPEQALGLEVDHRGDIYALGVILYELLTGRVPFDGDHYVAVLHQHLQTPPPAFASLDPPVILPAALERIVERCLAKSPNERFEDMAELARELMMFRAPLLASELPMNDVAPERPTSSERAASIAAAARGAAPPAALMAGALLSGALVPGPRSAPPRSATPRSAPPRSPIPRASFEPKSPALPAPRPTTPLPVPNPTLVLPRLSGQFSVQQKRFVTGLSVVVLIVVCVAAAFRLGTSRGGGVATPPGSGPSEPRATPEPRAGLAGDAPATAAPQSPQPDPRPSAAPPPVASNPSATPAAPGLPEPPPAVSPGAGDRSEPAASRALEPNASREGSKVRGNARERRTPSAASSKRSEASRPAPKSRAKDDFMNPWPAPR